MLVLLGSGSFAIALAGHPLWTAVGAAAVTFIASAQLVFDLSRRAKEEDVLKLECEKFVADAENPCADIARIGAAMATLYGRELETFHAGRPDSTLLVVKDWQKWLRHWRVSTPDDFPSREPSAS